MKLTHPAFPLIYMPWVIALIWQDSPDISYIVAWSGSFFIFYLTLMSRFSVNSAVLIAKDEIMRPIFLIQIIFAGFMCCTSIFYFIDHIKNNTLLIAKCQRLALLAHASLVSGMMVATKTRTVPIPQCIVNIRRIATRLCVISSLFTVLLNFTPEFIQFKYPLLALSATSGAYLLVNKAIRSHFSMALGGLVVASNFVNATLTGFKEGIIVQFITLTFIAFPYYKKTIILLGIPCGYILLYLLPTYTSLIREKSWTGAKTKEVAREQAYQTFFDDNNDEIILENNWKFLTDRSSEIGMFVRYVKHVPEFHEYYGLQILKDSFYALIPRALWADKPSTEVIAMQRVYTAGVVKRSSPISAKTRPVVDGYLMFGAPGVFITMLLYGIVTQLICNKAEKLFGGYEIGCIIIFNSLFQQLWRGNNFEFLLNNVFYAFLLMLLIHATMNITHYLRPPDYDHSRYPCL